MGNTDVLLKMLVEGKKKKSKSMSSVSVVLCD